MLYEVITAFGVYGGRVRAQPLPAGCTDDGNMDNTADMIEMMMKAMLPIWFV